jgi:hypothetical protein
VYSVSESAVLVMVVAQICPADSSTELVVAVPLLVAEVALGEEPAGKQLALLAFGTE